MIEDYLDWDEVRDNPIMWTDAYNLSHTVLKENTDREISHIYNRSRGMILYGFNHLVIKLLKTKIEDYMVDEAREFADKMGLMFPYDMWSKLVKDFNGRIPLRVQAVPDGTYVPKGTPFAQVMNTEDGFGELVTWWEPILLKCAFPSGCATRAMQISRYLHENKLQNHRVHSFGYRGHNSREDSIMAASAWNLFLTGTDDFHIMQYTPNAPMGSIMATAHKVTQQFNNEYEAEIHAIDSAARAEKNIIAMVIDTYDPKKFINEYLIKIAEYAKFKNIHVVFRPDSGDVWGQALWIYNKLKENNLEKGCSVIIGEGITFQKVQEYDNRFRVSDVPLDFVNYGMGSGFYKDIDRDWTGLAMKTAYSNGSDRMKLVKGDSFKQSIPGNVNLVRTSKGDITVEYTREGLYQDVYHFNARSDQPDYNRQSWNDIKKIAEEQIEKGYINQKDVILSPLVQSNIKKFQDKYW